VAVLIFGVLSFIAGVVGLFSLEWEEISVALITLGV
jgi:hypothetical protein